MSYIGSPEPIRAGIKCLTLMTSFLYSINKVFKERINKLNNNETSPLGGVFWYTLIMSKITQSKKDIQDYGFTSAKEKHQMLRSKFIFVKNVKAKLECGGTRIYVEGDEIEYRDVLKIKTVNIIWDPLYEEDEFVSMGTSIIKMKYTNNYWQQPRSWW